MSIEPHQAQHLLENIYTAVLVFDGDLRLVTINAAGENLLSLSQRKIQGAKLEEIFLASTSFRDTIKQALDTGQPCMEWGMELRLTNTREVLVDCRMTPWLKQDTCQEIIVEMVDAQSHVKVVKEESLSILHDAATQSLQGMAHEIKNPLGGLRGAAQLLEMELDGNSELTEYTQIIINEADRLRNLIDRMVTPKSLTEVAPVNVHEVLDYVLSVVEAEDMPGFEVHKDYDPSLPTINVDREQLIQALLNIIRNAFQAVDENGEITFRTRIARRLTIQQQYHKMALQLEIIDNGPGVPEEIEDGIFYPMVTGRADGTGLGLSIAQSLIQAHGGVIEYERVDARTIFRVVIPIQQHG